MNNIEYNKLKEFSRKDAIVALCSGIFFGIFVGILTKEIFSELGMYVGWFCLFISQLIQIIWNIIQKKQKYNENTMKIK